MKHYFERDGIPLVLLFTLYLIGWIGISGLLWTALFTKLPLQATAIVLIATTTLSGLWLGQGFYLFLRPLQRLKETVEQFSAQGNLPYPPPPVPCIEHKLIQRHLYSLAEKIQFRENALDTAAEKLGNTTSSLNNQRQLLLQNTRFATIGTVSVDVAHAVNHPLTVINHRLSSIEQQFKDYRPGESLSPPAAHMTIQHCQALLKDAMLATQQVHHVVQDLKMFSNYNLVTVSNVDIHHDVIEPALRLTQVRYRRKATIDKRFDFPHRDLTCCAKEMTQVIANLLCNAGDAIEGFGTITIKTSLKDANLCIEISDTGCGITEDELAQLYTPFYTTRSSQNQLGLGLTVAKELLDKMSATLNFNSEPGFGTTAIIHYPLHTP